MDAPVIPSAEVVHSHRQPATFAERATLSVLVAIVALGLAVDTRRHRTDTSLDTFFTSAHALLYTGWVACAVYLLYVVRKRLAGAQPQGVVEAGEHRSEAAERSPSVLAGAQPQGGRSIIQAVPVGFEGAVVGAMLFGVGGALDLLWHTQFGIERELKILFSPTHLLLMSAMLLMAFGPIRATWMVDEPARARTMWPVVLSAGALSSVLAVFFQYVSVFDRPVFTATFPAVLGLDKIVRTQSIVGLIITTAVLFGPVLLMARRWVLPLGACTLAFGVVAASNFIYMDFRPVRLTLVLIAGGVAADALAWVIRQCSPRFGFRLFGALAPLLLWSIYLLATVPGHPITWSVELWTGAVAWSALVGLAITVLLLPPVGAPHSYLDA